MSNFLDTVVVGDKVAIYDDRTIDYTIAEVDEVFETQIYVKNHGMPHIYLSKRATRSP